MLSNRKLHMIWTETANKTCRHSLSTIRALTAMLAMIDVIKCTTQDDGDPHFIPLDAE